MNNISEKELNEIKKYDLIFKEDNYYGSTAHGKIFLKTDLVDFNKVKNIIDVGCGQNNFKTILNNEYPHINLLGVDCSCEKADIISTAWDIPVANDEFDMVTSFDALEHLLPESIDKTLNEFKRISNSYIVSICDAGSCYGRHKNWQLHPTVKPISWWYEKFNKVSKEIATVYTFEIIKTIEKKENNLFEIKEKTTTETFLWGIFKK